MITPILPNMIPMRDIKQISEGDRLFYELGHKIRIMDFSYENNWVREGKFKEIKNIKEFIESDSDKLLSNLEYLEHHNFMIIKKINMEKLFEITPKKDTHWESAVVLAKDEKSAFEMVKDNFSGSKNIKDYKIKELKEKFYYYCT